MDLSLPCSPLCAEKLKTHPPKRPHVNCCTCLERRYHYNKVDRNDYVRLEANQHFAIVNPFSPIILPKNCSWYCLVINLNCSWLKMFIKCKIIKFCLTLAELFANW